MYTLQVGVKILLNNSEDKYLFLRRSATDQNHVPGLWDIPGGRIDLGATLLENLQRELYEETRMHLTETPQQIMAQDIIKPEKSLHVVRITYTASIDNQTPIVDGVEHDEFRWMTLSEFNHETQVGEVLRTCINHFQKQINQKT